MSEKTTAVLSVTDPLGTVRLQANLTLNALVYTPSISGADLLKLPSGSTVELSMTPSPGAATTTLRWTIERFLGRTFDTPAGTDALVLQFTHRCLLSETGYASWRINLSDGPYSRAQYSLTCQNTFQNDGNNTPVNDFFNHEKLEPMILQSNQADLARITQFFKRREANVRSGSGQKVPIVARFAPWDDKLFVYLATSVAVVGEDVSIGNGLTLYAEHKNDNQMDLWQPCEYKVVPSSKPGGRPNRTVLGGMKNISSKTVLRSWTSNLARRYYDGLSLKRAFSMVPELRTTNPQPCWETLISIEESVDFSVSPNDWTWAPQDSEEEYPRNVNARIVSVTRAGGVVTANLASPLTFDVSGLKLTIAGVHDQTFNGNYTVAAAGRQTFTYFQNEDNGTSTGGNATLTSSNPEFAMRTRVLRVRMFGGVTETVFADLGAFRQQDGRPVQLDQLTLESPPQQPDSGDKTAWYLKLKGYVDTKAKSSLVLQPGSNAKIEQVVRAGGFALHLLPASVAPIGPSSLTQYELDVRADFGLTSSQSSPGPVMPVVSCSLANPLPIWDAAPAGEDDLDADQYAQLNIGVPRQNADSSNSVVKLLDEIYRNMQRDQSVVFRRPSRSPVPIADGQWALKYSEQSSSKEKEYVSMQLLFTPTPEASDSNDESVLVFSRNPYSFADVHFHPLTAAQQLDKTTGTAVADWNSVSNEWRILQLNSSPSYMVLPPQVVGEESVTSKTNYPQGLDDGKATRMAVGTPTVITYATGTDAKAVKLPWDLQRLTTDASLNVSRIDYEMLYGMVATTQADHMRLTEAATLYGDLLGEFPALDLPADANTPQYAIRMRYLLARLHWSRIHREYRSRLGVFVVQNSTSTDPESFTDTTHTEAILRLDDTKLIDTLKLPKDQFMGPSRVPHVPPLEGVEDDSFKGGALSGVADEKIFSAIVNARSTGIGNAAVIDPRFSALGGFGTTRGMFDSRKSTLINTISMGRTVNYTVERVGRIGCHWNRAKHVIVYERTVVPSRQFSIEQKDVAFRGLPLVRKVEEYIEFVQPERIFAEESASPQAAFAEGFKCGERRRIAVDSAWGAVVPNQGWRVPLWNAQAAAALPEVYPKPQLYLEITSPEQALDSTDQQPHYLTADALLTHPEEVVFYTSYVETDDNTDNWKPVETVDCVGYPMLAPDSGVYDGGDLTQVPLPEFPTPPGWEAVTFRIAPPTVGVNVTAGVVRTRTPMAAQLTRVTVNRGARPKQTTTVRSLLANDAAGLKNYMYGAAPIATIPQAFASMRAIIAAEIAAPNTAQTQAELKANLTSLTGAASGLRDHLNDVSTGLKERIEQPFKDASTALKKQIDHDRAIVQSILQKIYADLVWVTASGNPPPTDAATARIAHLRQVFKATENVVSMWQTKTVEQITGVVRIWTDEIESVISAYSLQLSTPIGALSPVRHVMLALGDFDAALTVLEKDLDNVLQVIPRNGELANKTRLLAGKFDAAVSNLTSGLLKLHQAAATRSLDPTLVLLLLHTAGSSGQFQMLVDQTLQAASNAVEQSTERAAAVNGLTRLRKDLGGIHQNLKDVNQLFDENILDLLRQVPAVADLYSFPTVNQAKAAIRVICDTPETLVQSLQMKCADYLDKIGTQTQAALQAVAEKVAAWMIAQTSPIAGEINSLGPLLDPFRDFVRDLGKLDVTKDFPALQRQLDTMAGQYHGVVQQAAQYVDQYVRGPLMAGYKEIAPDADKAMRVLRAFGAPPQVPHLDIQPPVVGYLYDGVAAKVPITPVLARANQAGQVLNALGVHLPTVSLSDSLVPAALKNFQLSDVLPNFAGLRLPGLFSGIKLPDIDNRHITVTHGWEPQSRRAWLQADVDVPFTQRMIVFNAGFVSFVLTNATFAAQSRIQNVGAAVQQSTHGSITGTWNIEISDSNALISFASTTLAFDEHGKFQFLFRPDHLTLSDALKAITALVQGFSDPASGFTYGATPTGVKCAFALPVPDTAALTSGFTGLKFSTSLALEFDSDFKIKLAIGVSSKDRPFNFAIFILGGCGYLTAGVVYNISKRQFDAPTLELAIGVSASLAIALGPISGGVYAQFAIELRSNGGGFRAGAFFQITGHVSICGVLSIDMVFRLEASYGNGVMIASGHFSISVHFFMFSFSISRDVSMQMGSGGQSSSRLDAPPLDSEPFARPSRDLLASLSGPDGTTPGLAYALFGDDTVIAKTLATRYRRLLL